MIGCATPRRNTRSWWRKREERTSTSGMCWETDWVPSWQHASHFGRGRYFVAENIINECSFLSMIRCVCVIALKFLTTHTNIDFIILTAMVNVVIEEL